MFVCLGFLVSIVCLSRVCYCTNYHYAYVSMTLVIVQTLVMLYDVTFMFSVYLVLCLVFVCLEFVIVASKYFTEFLTVITWKCFMNYVYVIVIKILKKSMNISQHILQHLQICYLSKKTNIDNVEIGTRQNFCKYLIILYILFKCSP